MASFITAINITLAHEGGYVDDPDDRGGETVCGISRKAHPDWEGWKEVESIKDRMVAYKEFLNNFFNHALGKSMIYGLYKEEYWDKLRCNDIDEQLLANELFDIAVNMGVKRAASYLQRGINLINYDKTQITEDGDAGPLTIQALLDIPQTKISSLLKLIVLFKGNHYINIVKKTRSQGKFLRGWLKRVNL